MAEINIQPKSSNTMWWVLGVVALLVVVWLLFAGTGDSTPRTSLELELPASPQAAMLLERAASL
jgi:hypothetical protein